MTTPRIALITPYSGNNFGDAAIQDALMTNLRLRLPGAQFSGITLNSDNFLNLHGAKAFPLYASDFPVPGPSASKIRPTSFEASDDVRLSGLNDLKNFLRNIVCAIPLARLIGKKIRACASAVQAEHRHSVEALGFLRTHDLVIVSGGGQLDEEWGGPWAHPFCLFKWAILARLARIPFVVASIGAGKTDSFACRFFLWAALCLAQYRSYRDKHSHAIARSLARRAANDAVVPDLAFGLPRSEIADAKDVRARACGRAIVAISLISYGNPEIWPKDDRQVLDRYLTQMTILVSQLLRRNDYVVFVWSARVDQRLVAELLGRLDDVSKARIPQQVFVPQLNSWRDVVVVLRSADMLIASRLHSTIFGFLARVPTVAISFDRKVDWIMEDLKQTDYLLNIRDFTAADVLAALEQIGPQREKIVREIAAYQEHIRPLLDAQCDALAVLCSSGSRSEANKRGEDLRR